MSNNINRLEPLMTSEKLPEYILDCFLLQEGSPRIYFSDNDTRLTALSMLHDPPFAMVYSLDPDKYILEETADLPLPAFVHDLQYSPDGEYLSKAKRKMFDEPTRITKQRLEHHLIRGTCSKPEIDLSSKIAEIYKRLTGKLIISSEEHPGFLCHVAFSPDNIHFATGCTDKVARIFEIDYEKRKMNKIIESDPQKWRVTCVDFSQNGKYLGLCDGSNLAKIFEIDYSNNKLNLALTLEHSNDCFNLRFSNNGEYLATSCKSGHIRVSRIIYD